MSDEDTPSAPTVEQTNDNGRGETVESAPQTGRLNFVFYTIEGALLVFAGSPLLLNFVGTSSLLNSNGPAMEAELGIEGALGACLMLFALFMALAVFGLPRRWGIRRWLNCGLFLLCFVAFFSARSMVTLFFKPVILLYPETSQELTVQLDYEGKITADYPAYDSRRHGWHVRAEPSGDLTDLHDGQHYAYIFWEGRPRAVPHWDLSTGFVVAGSDVRRFLHETLSEYGLSARERDDFVSFWYPQLQNNRWNLIHFATDEYTSIAKLKVMPTPQTLLRVFMVATALSKPAQVLPQVIPHVERRGFTVVEWGGTIVR